MFYMKVTGFIQLRNRGDKRLKNTVISKVLWLTL